MMMLHLGFLTTFVDSFHQRWNTNTLKSIWRGNDLF